MKNLSINIQTISFNCQISLGDFLVKTRRFFYTIDQNGKKLQITKQRFEQYSKRLVAIDLDGTEYFEVVGLFGNAEI